MLIGKLQPPAESDEKWRAVKIALEDDAKTRRMARLMLVNKIPFLAAIEPPPVWWTP